MCAKALLYLFRTFASFVWCHGIKCTDGHVESHDHTAAAQVCPRHAAVRQPVGRSAGLIPLTFASVMVAHFCFALQDPLWRVEYAVLLEIVHVQLLARWIGRGLGHVEPVHDFLAAVCEPPAFRCEDRGTCQARLL